MENKKSKKKVLLYYLILAACLLVIAAVTVTIVLTVGRKTPSISDGQQTEEPDDSNNPGSGNKPDDSNNPGSGNKPDDSNTPSGGNKPTGGDNSYGLPVANASMFCGYEFTFDKTLDRYAVHQGMDFAGTAGDSVFAVMDGTVSKVVTDHILGENYVTITHANGLTSTYKYINASEGLAVGTSVKKGDVIGVIAEAKGMEMNEGEHLHFEMAINGKTVDPDTYLEIVEK